jgi:Nif-specific regulatory protein
MKNVSRLEDLVAETRALQRALRLTHEMIGGSEPMQQVYDFIGKVSRADSTVLITGESGTGKELVARALHKNSDRVSGPFVAINCAAIAESLLESEMFGHERGSFTGADATKRGKLETAAGGTLFLDEVGELSPALQSKLLRVLQFREFERVGGTRTIKVDIRVISATNRDLEKDAAEGRFRRDLLFRLNVLPLRMPPLRERRQDIPLLAVHFAKQITKRMECPPVRFSSAAIRRLMAYDWPGNVRELENAVERAVVLRSGPEIGPDDLPEAVAETVVPETSSESRFHASVTELKRRLVLDAIAEAHGRLTDAARLLGLHPNYLHRLRRNLGLRD